MTFSAGQHIIADNSSQYGTWLNEERLTAARPLKHGDVVKLARDVRRETDAMQRQALLDAKMTVGSWASRYLGTPRWGASFRYKNS